ncbi:MAG: hypothetical protein FJW26_18630 [Acidimicrobiia bacterium]|nr:hypothetical protein [Acidimicrobiia bacterium]
MTPVAQRCLFGFQLLLRFVIVVFCVAAGPALMWALRFALVALAVEVPVSAVVFAQLISLVVVGSLLLAGYADYCGSRPIPI